MHFIKVTYLEKQYSVICVLHEKLRIQQPFTQ